TVTLADPGGRPYEGAVGRLTASSPDAGVYFASPGGAAGQFGCAAAPVQGPCPAGVYSLDVYASLAGAKRISVAYAGAAGGGLTIKEKGTGADHVTAVFVTPPADPAASVFVLGDPVVNPDETNPQDDWDNPADNPDGGDSLAHDAGIAFHPNVRIWDAGRRNPIDGAEVRLTLGPSCPAKFADGTDVVTARTSAAGKVGAVVDSSVAGQCSIAAEVFAAGAWQPVKGSPKLLTWVDAAIDASASAFTVSDATVVADGAATGTVSVDLVGAGGQPVVGAAGRLIASGPAGGDLKVSAFSPAATPPGRYTASFSGLKAGDLAVAVMAAGAGLPLVKNGNRFARMVAGAPAAAASWLVQPAGTAPADDSTSLAVKAHVFDANGNPADSGSVVFAIPAGTAATTPAGTSAGPASVTVPVAGGWAQFALTARVAGVHKIAAAVAGSDLSEVKNAAEDAVLRSDGQVEAAFVAGPPDPAASVLTIPTAGADGQTAVVVGGAAKHTAEVQVRDAQGNPVPAGSARVVFSWEYTDLTGAQVTGAAAAAAVDAQGAATYDFASNVAATWLVSARVEGSASDVAGSPKPARFVHGPLDRLATLGSFAVDPGANPADGIAHADARMRAQDQYGNPIQGIDLEFRVDHSGNQGPLFGDAETGSKTLAQTSGADGWIRGQLYSIWPGDFDVRGVCDAALSGAGTVHFQGVPADPAASWFNVRPAAGNAADPALADGRDAYEVTVGLADANKAALNGAGAVVYFTPQAIAGAQEIRRTLVTGTAGRGLAASAFATLKAGVWEVSVRIGNDPVATNDASPAKAVTVVFAPGPVSVAPGASRLISPPSPAKADGQATQAVQAEVRDANGNAIGGQTVVFEVPAGLTARPPGQAAVAGPASVSLATAGAGARAGLAELVLTSTTTGSYEVAASVGGEAFAEGAPAGVVFVNSDLSPAKSEFQITTAPAAKTVATEYHVAQVTLRDASGNLYSPTTAVAFAYRLAGTSAWTAGPTLNTVGGVATWDDFTVNVAGLYQVRAEVAAGQVPDATTLREARFAPGPASAAQSTLTVSTGEVLPNDLDQHSATVRVADALGNPIAGQSVAFTLPAGGPAHFATAGCSAQTCSVTASAAGLAAVEVASPVETTAHIVAALGPGAKVGEADLVFAAGAPEASKSSWTINPSGSVTADGSAAFTASVQVDDANGLPKSGAEVGFAVPPAVRIAEAGPYRTDQNGRLTVHFTSTVAGVQTVNAKIGSASIPPADRQISFAAGQVSFDPARTLLRGPSGTALADGADAEIVTAVVEDAHGNPAPGALVRFAIPAGLNAAPGASLEVKVDANGRAELRLVSRRAGRYQVTAEVKDVGAADYRPIAGGSPAAVEFVAGPAA
ncbi:MAG: Ig-like domain-containing protein, partial [Bifidobacteriaceae bacterium]|nr:Ig-like domain-containing protein [Bifidobacteriaceae bacterium]